METIGITERQHKLSLLKKFKESDKWKGIVKYLENKREIYGESILNAYVLSSGDDETEDFTEKKLYNDKNKAVWLCTSYNDFIISLGSGEAEDLLKEKSQDTIKNAEDFIRYSHGTSMNTFRSATDVEFTETDKLAVKANLLRDQIKLVDTLIGECGKEEKKDVPAFSEIEDNTDLEA